MTTDVDHLAELDDPNDPDSDYGRGYRAALDAVLAALRDEAEQQLARAHDLPERAYARGIAYSSYFLEPWLREGAGIVRHLAATTPPTRPSATEPAENAPAVGREAAEARGGAEDDLVDRAIDYVPLAEHEELRAERNRLGDLANGLVQTLTETRAELAATRNNRLISAIFGHHKDAPRPFALHRRTDVTGVSGTGVVAEGAAFSDGTAVLRWLSDWPTSVVFHDRGMDAIEAVHGHGGATQIVWLSDELEPLAEMEAERDRLADTLQRVRELVDSYPPGSNFAQSGLQQLFRRTLDSADREQKTAHPAASADIRTGPDTLSWADAAARVSADAQAIEASREDLAEREGQRYADLARRLGPSRGRLARRFPSAAVEADPDWACRNCQGPLTPCVACGQPALCGDSWCADCTPGDEPAGSGTDQTGEADA